MKIINNIGEHLGANLATVFGFLDDLPHGATLAAAWSDKCHNSVIDATVSGYLGSEHVMAAQACTAQGTDRAATWHIVRSPGFTQGAACTAVHLDAEESCARVAASEKTVFPFRHVEN